MKATNNVFLTKPTAPSSKVPEPFRYSSCWSKHPAPADVYSDWKIVVVATIGTLCEVASYSVHQLVLGPQSQVLEGAFRLQERSCKWTKLFLPSHIATHRHFESLLNYLYAQEKLVIQHENAIPMMYLADAMGIPQLKRFVETFVRETLRTANGKVLAHYYRGGVLLQRRDLQDAILHHLAVRGETCFEAEWAWWTMIDMAFWHRLWAIRKESSSDNCLFWSRMLAFYLRLLDMQYQSTKVFPILEEDFRRLTAIDVLPSIDPCSATTLMEIEQRFMVPTHKLTVLQKRCMEALYDRASRTWKIPKEYHLILGQQLWKLPRIVEYTLLLWTMS